MSDNPNQWYLSGNLSIDGNATLNAPDQGIYSLQLNRIDESGRQHRWAFWHMNSQYRKNSLEIWEYLTDSSGKDCSGNPADGAMCAPRLVIAEGGNVGIGTSIPKAKLHIEGGAIMPAAGDGDNAGILFPSDPGGGGGDKAWIRYYPRPGGGSSERTVLEIGVANDTDPNYQDDISLMPSGTVGIGTREPQAKLHVKGNAGVLTIEGVDHGYIQFFPQSTAQRRGWIGSRSAGDHAFTISSDNERMHITGGEHLFLLNKGGVIISKAWEGNGNLSVDGDIAIGGKHAFRGNDTWLRLNQDGAFANGVHTPGVFAPVSLNVGGMNGWGNPGSGNAWFTGTITYSGQLNKLDVAEGDAFARIRAHDLLFGHSSRRGEMGRALVDEIKDITVFAQPTRSMKTLHINYGADWQAVYISGIVQTPSSRQLKENIRFLSSEAAERIISVLEPVRFTYKQDTLKLECLGFIAEDTPPEVASPTHDAIAINHIVAALTRVVKDQEQSITELNLQVNLLKNRIFNSN